MSGVAPVQQSKWSARRISLLAGVAGLGAAVFFAAPGFLQNPGMPSAAYAQDLSKQAKGVPRPVGFADIVEKVKPAVISVRVRMTADSSNVLGDNNLPFPKGSPMDRFFRRFGMPNNVLPHNDRPRRHNFVTGQGSGFFISADGYAVTNNHVVDKAEKVQVTTDDGKTYTAKVIGTDPRTDVALIKVEGRSDFPYVHFASGHPRIGDWVLAVGNPFGLGGTVTAGIVSARGRDIGAGPYDDFIQIDAPVNRGNSGGPTFDVDGNVIGVNTAIFSPSGGSVGIAFAIPSETVQSVVAQLKDKGTVTRGWIGVQIQPVTAEIAESLGMKDAHGAIVAQPQDNSPAVKAGIKAGDVIVNVNGHKVKDARDLAKQIGGMSPGTSVKLEILRDGKQQNVALTLGKMPNERQASNNQPSPPSSDDNSADVPKLGLTLAPASDVAGSGKDGVVVTDVAPDGVAAEHGFKTGDIIVEVAGKKVANPKDVRSAISVAQKNGKRTVLLRVKSSEGMKFVALRIGNA